MPAYGYFSLVQQQCSNGAATDPRKLTDRPRGRVTPPSTRLASGTYKLNSVSVTEGRRRLVGAFVGALAGLVLAPLVVLLVVVASGAFKIRWPTSHAIVLLLFTFAPIIVGALAGITVAPSARRWVEAIQLAIQTDRDSRVGTDDRSTLTIHVSRGFTSIYAVLGLAMTGAALFDAMVVASSDVIGVVVGWIGVVFFGVATFLFLMQVALANHFGLTLDREGFVVAMNLGRRRYRWAQVECFFTYRTVALYPIVVFKYRGKAEVSGIQMTRSRLGRFDGSLPQNLSIRGHALLELMEAWRSRMTGAG